MNHKEAEAFVIFKNKNGGLYTLSIDSFVPVLNGKF